MLLAIVLLLAIMPMLMVTMLGDGVYLPRVKYVVLTSVAVWAAWVALESGLLL